MPPITEPFPPSPDMLQANGIVPVNRKRKRAESTPDEVSIVKSESEDAKRIQALEASV
jgi:hypothetical protein